MPRWQNPPEADHPALAFQRVMRHFASLLDLICNFCSNELSVEGRRGFDVDVYRVSFSEPA